MDRKRVDELLNMISTMTLATVDSAGKVHATPLYFAGDENWCLYFFSEPDTRHGINLQQNPKAAVGIYPQVHGWREICGLQMHGVVRVLSRGEQWDKGWRLYQQKFPFAVQFLAQIKQSKFYAFIPEWVRLIDNRVRFGYKKEWDLNLDPTSE